MKKRFTEEQIIRVLEEAKTGIKIEELCRKQGISQPTYYNWKAKFGGTTISEAKRLRAMETQEQQAKEAKSLNKLWISLP
jgi:putative transposase